MLRRCGRPSRLPPAPDLSTASGPCRPPVGPPSYTGPVTSTDAFEAGPDRALERTPPQDLDDVGDRVLGQHHPAEHGLLGDVVLGRGAAPAVAFGDNLRHVLSSS